MTILPTTVTQPERCAGCRTLVEPKEAAAQIALAADRDLVVPMWAYRCACGRFWANFDQRSINYHAYKRARRFA